MSDWRPPKMPRPSGPSMRRCRAHTNVVRARSAVQRQHHRSHHRSSAGVSVAGRRRRSRRHRLCVRGTVRRPARVRLVRGDERVRGRDRTPTGAGRVLYGALLAILTAQGYRQAMAGIALPNQASVRLHESVGFSAAGVYRSAGWKLGSWHDVGWWQRALAPTDGAPPAPTPFTDLHQHHRGRAHPSPAMIADTHSAFLSVYGRRAHRPARTAAPNAGRCRP